MQQWVPLGCRYCPSWHCTCLFSLLKGLEGSVPSKGTWWTCSIYGTGAISTDSFVNKQTNVRITCKYRGRGKERRRETRWENIISPCRLHSWLQHLQLKLIITVSYVDLTDSDIRTLHWQKRVGIICQEKTKQNNEQNKPMSAICVINMVYLLIQTSCIYRKYFSLCEIYRWNALKLL